MYNSQSDQDLLRFEAMLPFFVTGQLSEDDRLFMQTFIDANPTVSPSVDFTITLSRTIRSTGKMRDSSVTLRKLVEQFNALHSSESKGMLSQLQTVVTKRSLPFIIAIAILGGQAINLAITEFIHQDATKDSVTNSSRVSVTLKKGIDTAALAVVASKFGGQIIHSSEVEGITKFFVEILDKTRLQAFIDALIESGLVESAVILF